MVLLILETNLFSVFMFYFLIFLTFYLLGTYIFSSEFPWSHHDVCKKEPDSARIGAFCVWIERNAMDPCVILGLKIEYHLYLKRIIINTIVYEYTCSSWSTLNTCTPSKLSSFLSSKLHISKTFVIPLSSSFSIIGYILFNHFASSWSFIVTTSVSCSVWV